MSKTDLERLSEPFDSSVVKTVTKTIRGEQVTLSNVAPAHYIGRLLEIVPQANIELGDPIIVLDSAIAVKCRIEIGGIVKEGLGAEPILSTDPDDVAFSVKSAASDALKLAATKFGMGLGLYLGREADRDTPNYERRTASQGYERPEPGEPAPRQERQQSSSGNVPPGYDPKWDGSMKLKFNKDYETFADLPGADIEWYLNRDQADPSKAGDQMYAKERARRVYAGTYDPTQKGKFRGKGGNNAVKRNLADL